MIACELVGLPRTENKTVQISVSTSTHLLVLAHALAAQRRVVVAVLILRQLSGHGLNRQPKVLAFQGVRG